jgi:ABC-2 type transport system permease protein
VTTTAERTRTARAAAGGRVVAGQELRDLWLGGRGLVLLTAFSFLLSVVTFLVASNEVLNFLEQREAVALTLQVAVAVGVLVTLVVSADAISGERERGTLESLLLAPVSRRAILAGKLGAALSLWAAAYLITVPYLLTLARGVAIGRQALLLGLIVGGLLAVGMAGLGLVISSLAGSNRASLAISLFLLLALAAPSQFPLGPASALTNFLDRLNPVASGLKYFHAVLVTGHAPARDWTYLISPLVLAVAAVAVVLALAPRLVRLGNGRGRK